MSSCSVIVFYVQRKSPCEEMNDSKVFTLLAKITFKEQLVYAICKQKKNLPA